VRKESFQGVQFCVKGRRRGVVSAHAVSRSDTQRHSLNPPLIGTKGSSLGFAVSAERRLSYSVIAEENYA
jgi:hypothetical protein